MEIGPLIKSHSTKLYFLMQYREEDSAEWSDYRTKDELWSCAREPPFTIENLFRACHVRMPCGRYQFRIGYADEGFLVDDFSLPSCFVSFRKWSKQQRSGH